MSGTPRIEWERLSQDDLEFTLNKGREEAARRAQRLMALLGLAEQKGPGRKAADPLSRLIAEFEDSSETEDAAAADSGLS